MDQPALFPDEAFTLWLKDAVTTAGLMEKLRVAASAQGSSLMTPEECALLSRVHGEVPVGYSNVDAIAELPVGAPLPVLSAGGLQVVWNVLTAYIGGSAYYVLLREALGLFLHTNPGPAVLLAHIIGCFGPAFAPREAWGCIVPS